MLKIYEKNLIKFIFKIIFLIFSIIFLYFRPFFITKVVGSSMEPTFKSGQIILTNSFDKNYSIGDVVLAEQNSELILKRIAYVGGQKIPIVDLGIRKYQPLPIIKNMDDHMQHLRNEGIRSEYLTIPQNHVFLIGDNGNESEDSRSFGPLPIEKIKAKIVEF